MHIAAQTATRRLMFGALPKRLSQVALRGVAQVSKPLAKVLRTKLGALSTLKDGSFLMIAASQRELLLYHLLEDRVTDEVLAAAAASVTTEVGASLCLGSPLTLLLGGSSEQHGVAYVRATMTINRATEVTEGLATLGAANRFFQLAASLEPRQKQSALPAIRQEAQTALVAGGVKLIEAARINPSLMNPAIDDLGAILNIAPSTLRGHPEIGADLEQFRSQYLRLIGAMIEVESMPGYQLMLKSTRKLQTASQKLAQKLSLQCQPEGEL